MTQSAPGPSVLEMIAAKRSGHRLGAGDIQSLFSSYLGGEVGDEQMAALLMAICWRGMDSDELSGWTGAMVGSGVRLDLTALSRPTVDKHSTGGVGDKVSLVLAPLVAACGAAVPQLSGRGLGHTGGTLDKMESIPGWRAELTATEMLETLETVGCVICAASPELAPADRRLYALRDRTGTVDSLPLIASSIISKKVAEGTGALLLDVKVGTGAFLPEIGQARALAQTMLELATAYGVKTAALLTEMDTPLGQAVGNALEVSEAIEVLHGGGPTDLRELVVQEAREMLQLVGLSADPKKALDDGRAWASFSAMVRAQGGDPDAALPQGATLHVVEAERGGVLWKLDAKDIGVASWRLGAGRASAHDSVSPGAGVICRAIRGQMVSRGDPLLELVGDEPSKVGSALAALTQAIEIRDDPYPESPKVLERLLPQRDGGAGPN